MLFLDQYDIVYQLIDYDTDDSEEFMSCCDGYEHEDNPYDYDDSVDFQSCEDGYATGEVRFYQTDCNNASSYAFR
jgi:hypothetical protein